MAEMAGKFDKKYSMFKIRLLVFNFQITRIIVRWLPIKIEPLNSAIKQSLGIIGQAQGQVNNAAILKMQIVIVRLFPLQFLVEIFSWNYWASQGQANNMSNFQNANCHIDPLTIFCQWLCTNCQGALVKVNWGVGRGSSAEDNALFPKIAGAWVWDGPADTMLPNT